MEQLIEIRAKDYIAVINPARGANCVSLRNTRYQANILREPDYTKELDNPFLYGMPVLFPVNRISGGSFEFEGRIYSFPINEPVTGCHLHGVLHETPFGIKEQGEHFVTCFFEGSYPGFPQSFRVEISYTLSEKGLEQVTQIFNLSQINMPVFLGFHTTFNVPFLEDGKPEDIRIHAEISDYIERDPATYLPTGNIPAPDKISKLLMEKRFSPVAYAISRHYRAEGNGLIQLYDAGNNITLVYANDSKYQWRLFYNMNAEGYIVLEPMTCMANCQNSPFDRAYAGFDYISPNTSKKYVSRLYLQEGSP